ncbi:MAG: glycerol-3-phosphate 1-O-acyltransferase PlsY [Desulfobacterales bacterium]|nr:glycerol-3-phosphate 1-O-acyltransferase PlsY [Desulfobacterales bacterium]
MRKAILLLPFAYLLGSVPWGVILTRIFYDVDLRAAGSKNIGAHNVFRVAGKRLGLMTLGGDLLKGAIPVLVGISWLGISDWKGEVLVCLVALSAFAGHLFPVFLGFKGGKGVATAAGCFLVISPFVFLVCVLVYVLVLCCSGYSSAGSLSAAAILPGAIWLATHSLPITGCAFIMALLIFVRHADNIKRLLEGTEHSSLRP